MSEEEKKAIEKALWYFQEVLIHEDDIDQWGVIVNYIEKQQKEIEELKKYMKTNLIPKSTINLLYISKDKIREKIKELEKELAKGKPGPFEFAMTTNQRIKFNIKILQELLEE